MNPKLKDFIKDNERITLLGLAWALYWRLNLVIGSIWLGLVIIIGLLG